MEHGQPTSDNTAIKMIPSPPVAFNWQQPLRGGTSWAPSPSMLEFHLTWSFTGLVKVTSAYEFMTAICMSFKENTISEHSSQPLVHTFFCLLFYVLWVLDRRLIKMYQLGGEYSQTLVISILNSYDSLHWLMQRRRRRRRRQLLQPWSIGINIDI